MNKSEKVLAAKKNFRDGRGSTAAYKRAEWLRNLRRERQTDVRTGWIIYCHPIGCQIVEGTFTHAKICAKRISAEFPDFCVHLVDYATQITVWEN